MQEIQVWTTTAAMESNHRSLEGVVFLSSVRVIEELLITQVGFTGVNLEK